MSIESYQIPPFLLTPVLQRVASHREQTTVYPPPDQVFRALTMTPLHRVKVVIIGQDPYPQAGQADGLAFSSDRLPKSLQNIFSELHHDLGLEAPTTGRLDAWAQQGVLLLNRILTVNEGKPLSHSAVGWQEVTSFIVHTISTTQPFVVFLLWGRYAPELLPWIDSRHHVLRAPHPSPLSAYRGFFGSKPFSQANAALQQHGIAPIEWSLLKS